MKQKITKFGILTIGIYCFLCAQTSHAAENVAKIKGIIEVVGLNYSVKGDESQKKLSTHNKRYALYSSGHFFVDYHLIMENDWKYGTKLSLKQTSRNDRSSAFHIYVESDGYGKIELGSDKSAQSKMMITGYKALGAYGNGWDPFVVTASKKAQDAKISYVTSFASFLDSKTRTTIISDYSRKISYYTPLIGSATDQIQLGLSYIPDSSNAGHDNVDAVHIHSIVSGSDFKFAFKDGIAYGLTYSKKISDELSAKISLVGENAKPIAFDKNTNNRANVQFKQLNAYNIGTEVTYNQINISASYMDYNKSVTNPNIDKNGRDTKLYSIGAKYKFAEQKYSIGVNHFHSDNKKNKLDAESIGFDYFVTNGVKAYAQLTYFSTDGKYIKDEIIYKDKTRGAVIILGGNIAL